MVPVTIGYKWRGAVDDVALAALHAEAFGHGQGVADWRARLERHSLGWVCARETGELVGFVNVAWDGASHAFILDTLVSRTVRHRGVGTTLVAIAGREARTVGCQWLHVDFEKDLEAFYLDACGFRPTSAGLLRL